MPAAALAAVRTAAFAACLVLGLASCKMDMDDSAGGGRLAFYIDRATAYNLNSAGGRIIEASVAAERSAADYSGLYLDISITGAVEQTKTVSVKEGTVVAFDQLPAGGTVQVKAEAYRRSAAYGRLVYFEGMSEPFVIQPGDNAITLPVAMLSRCVPLTFEAITDGTITIARKWSTLRYTQNGGALTAPVSDSIDVTAGDVVCLYAAGSENPDDQLSNCMNITSSADCYLYGNVMSLLTLSGEDWNPHASVIAQDYAFESLFNQSGSDTHLKSHASKQLCLPAVTLSRYCYDYMFSGCAGLTRTPELPAIALADSCYHAMFNRCTGLTASPALPAETLADFCYSEMFSGCTGLTAAPALPALTLADGCYKEMFNGCTELTSAPELPAMTLAEVCYWNMFVGCTGLTASPVLGAPVLVKRCYETMFANCSKLNTITCLATNKGAENALSNWVDGVASSGTFYKASAATWETGDSGIPSGWTTADYSGN